MTTADRKCKILLRAVSGQLAGGLTAVMGPSGSGKSTLLNALALRLDPRVRVSGERMVNGRPYNSTLLKQISGYVQQVGAGGCVGVVWCCLPIFDYSLLPGHSAIICNTMLLRVAALHHTAGRPAQWPAYS